MRVYRRISAQQLPYHVTVGRRARTEQLIHGYIGIYVRNELFGILREGIQVLRAHIEFRQARGEGGHEQVNDYHRNDSYRNADKAEAAETCTALLALCFLENILHFTTSLRPSSLLH